ncbi:SMAD/FHA domain-containing protein [Helicostylum pulchrum]|nr:SMAD/FHA domain-containing protein [Helicostylum pulchrum]
MSKKGDLKNEKAVVFCIFFFFFPFPKTMMTESSTVMPVHDETVKLTKPKGPMTIQKRGTVITVILRPHNTNFQTRTLELRDKVRIRIGRQTSAKTVPTVHNGYFDSKVLSRQHAEIWCDKTKVFIKDVKSSNGTFVNGSRLSNECEESEPKELKNQDEIEFGIDIVNDNGAVMYHKVSCSVHIFSMPLSQVDDAIIKDLSNTSQVQIYPDPHLSRKTSTSSINTLSSVNTAENGSVITTTTAGKRAKKLESVLAKLHAEIEKSRLVENELKSIKDTVMDLDKVFGQEKMRKTDELQFKLTQAETKIKLFDEKWRQQTRSILTAKNELQRLEKELAKADDWKIERSKLMQELLDEQKKSRLLHEQLKKQGNFLDAFQVYYKLFFI